MYLLLQYPTLPLRSETTGRAGRARRPKLHPPPPNPTHTSLGMSNERETLLGQEARNSRVTRWGRASARVVATILIVMFVLGPSRALEWVVVYLIPTAVVLGVVA